ncbi:MAG: hypothetical protein LAO24_21660 [Acidobacteriia bacterium]|nr:hypothetical protein [Terriglobia bacterium]
MTLLIAGIGFAFFGTATAQQSASVHQNVSRALQKLHSQTWADRSKAFEEAAALLASKQTPGDNDKLRVGLIQLLATENIQTKILANHHNADEDAEEKDTEEYSEYYANLIGAVADLKDERAVPSLLGAANTGGMATRGIARFGKKALNLVLEQASSRDPSLASGAVFVIREMLEMHTVTDPDSHQRMKNALRLALGSPDFGVRDSAIYAIEYLDDREEFVIVLNEVAEHDPFKLAGEKPDDSRDIGKLYPVRHHARSLLRKIAEHQPPVIDKGIRH